MLLQLSVEGVEVVVIERPVVRRPHPELRQIGAHREAGEEDRPAHLPALGALAVDGGDAVGGEQVEEGAPDVGVAQDDAGAQFTGITLRPRPAHPDRAALLHQHSGRGVAEVDRPPSGLDPLRQPVGDDLPAAARVERALKIVVGEPGVQHEADAARREAIVPILSRDHRAEQPILGAGVEEGAEGDLAVQGGEAGGKAASMARRQPFGASGRVRWRTSRSRRT